MLDRRGHHGVAGSSPRPRQTVKRGTDRGRRAAGMERQLLGTRAESGCQHLSGLIQKGPRSPRLPIEATRIGPASLDRGEQSLRGQGVHLPRGGV